MRPATILRDAVIVVVLGSAVGISSNALRTRGIDFVASRHYDIFVPCTEPVGEAEPLGASLIRWGAGDELVLDARSPDQHERWHPEGVANVAFDFLLPVPEEVLGKIARSRSKRVVVIGDGLVPDTGEQLARELNSLGIKNVYYVEGGMKAVREQVEKEGMDRLKKGDALS